MALVKAISDRSDFVNALAKNPQLGGAIAGFSGSGFKENFIGAVKRGYQKIKPIAYSALKEAIQGFQKGFNEKEGDLGEKALSGLSMAGKKAGVDIAKNIQTQLGGKINPHGSSVAIMEGKGVQMSKPRMVRPKLK